MNYAVVLSSVFTIHVLAMISPGPNVLIVTQTAIGHTRRAGIVTALGVATGSATWAGTALFGLSIVFEQLAWLYGGLKILGGMHLLYLGIKLWRIADHPPAISSFTHAPANTDWRAFRLGLLTNLTNPKALVFLAAFSQHSWHPRYPRGSSSLPSASLPSMRPAGTSRWPTSSRPDVPSRYTDA
jgi:threonine efflux protein